MTLGGWVRDYLYIPLGGNRRGEGKKMRNLFVSMLIIGLWHGAGWTFVLWGGLHGVLLVINHQWRRLQLQLPLACCRVLTFLSVLVCWVFFRADTFTAGWQLCQAMLDWQQLLGGQAMAWGLPAAPVEVWSLLALLLVLTAWMKNPLQLVASFRADWRWLAASVLLMLWSLYALAHVSDFLYFQF